MAYWVLEPGQALVVEAQPPRCDYRMFILHNHWLESLDYRFRHIHLNNHTTHLERHGSVRVIVAHDDLQVHRSTTSCASSRIGRETLK
jgi:hypothetical protein